MKKQTIKQVESRREFFKKTAKAILPVLGIVFLAQIPTSSIYAATSCDECEGACYGTCSGTCNGTCKGDCDESCKGTCDGSCNGSCGDRCIH